MLNCSLERRVVSAAAAAPNGGEGNDVCDTNAVTDDCDYEFFCGDTADCSGTGVCCYDGDPEVTTSNCCEQRAPTGQIQFCDPSLTGECLGGTACTGTFSVGGVGTTYAASASGGTHGSGVSRRRG